MSASVQCRPKSGPPLTTTFAAGNRRACIRPCSSRAVNAGDAWQSGVPDPRTMMAWIGTPVGTDTLRPLRMPWKKTPTVTSHTANAVQSARHSNCLRGLAKRQHATRCQHNASSRNARPMLPGSTMPKLNNPMLINPTASPRSMEPVKARTARFQTTSLPRGEVGLFASCMVNDIGVFWRGRAGASSRGAPGPVSRGQRQMRAEGEHSKRSGRNPRSGRFVPTPLKHGLRRVGMCMIGHYHRRAGRCLDHVP